VDLALRAISTPRAQIIVVEDLLTEAVERVGPRRGEAVLLTEATKLGLCQVRSNTDCPCLREAVMKMWGMPFCKLCAREQETYFAIGELTQEEEEEEEEAQGLRNERLVEALGRMRWERMCYTAAEEMENPKVILGSSQ
jgi:hypothetical protein